MAQGAVQAVQAMGLKMWDGSEGIIVVGADGLKSGFEQIRSGGLTATVDGEAWTRAARRSRRSSCTSFSATASTRSSTCPPSLWTAKTSISPRHMWTGRLQRRKATTNRQAEGRVRVRPLWHWARPARKERKTASVKQFALSKQS